MLCTLTSTGLAAVVVDGITQIGYHLGSAVYSHICVEVCRCGRLMQWYCVYALYKIPCARLYLLCWYHKVE
jgi:hypothetical protein